LEGNVNEILLERKKLLVKEFNNAFVNARRKGTKSCLVVVMLLMKI